MDRAGKDRDNGGVAVYMRISNDRGTVENQRPDLERYLLAYNITPYGWYEDEGVSGRWVAFPDRPQGKRLMADVRDGHVQLILVWRLDRFGRNAREIHDAVGDLEQIGARIVSLKEQFDTRTAAGRLMFGVLAAVAEFEWESIMERSEAGMERRLAEGRWMGGRVPYGYRIEGKEHSARLVPDDTPLTLPDGTITTAADVARLIFRLTVEQNMSTIAIADELQRRGVPTAFAMRGKRYPRRGQEPLEQPPNGIWRPSAVGFILSNPVYRGEYTFGRHVVGKASRAGRGHGRAEKPPRDIVICPVPPLVSLELWDAAQAAVERHALYSFRNAKRDYLLRGLMRCASCGHLYIGDRLYYVCYGARRAGSLYGRELGKQRRCQALALRVKDIERDIWADVEGYLRNPDEALALIAASMDSSAATSDSLRADLAQVQQEQAEKQSERDSVVALFRKGRISERDLDRQLDDIAREEMELAKRTAQLTDELATASEVSAKLSGAQALLLTLRDRLDQHEVTPRTIIETLVAEMTVRIEPGEDGRPRPVVRVQYCFDPDNSLDFGIATECPTRFVIRKDRRARYG